MNERYILKFGVQHGIVSKPWWKTHRSITKFRTQNFGTCEQWNHGNRVVHLDDICKLLGIKNDILDMI